MRGLYSWNNQLFSVKVRNVFDKEHRYKSELQWSFPIIQNLRGLVQRYNGYGENMIDYNHDNHRIGVGTLMTDWL
jgi:phospholipase A1